MYKAEMDGCSYALKWYKIGEFLENIDKKAFRANLAKKIEKGPPAQQFLWPKMLTQEINGAFGYAMDLYPTGYISFEDYYWGKAYFPSWLSIIETALSLVEGFMGLHRKGYSYQDLNHGGFRANPAVGGTKRVLICDTDNVAPDGVNLGIQGFRGFMAPEVTTQKSLPNTLTDLHSLAVVLFGLFFRGHPLEGRHTLEYAALCTPGIDRIIYGSHPLFCFDPTDARNRPDPVVHKNSVLYYWPIFPKEFKELFVKAFTLGLFDPNKRVLAADWRKALINLRSSIVYIKKGGVLHEQFCSLASDAMPPGCLKLRFADGQMAALSHGSRLYAFHTAKDAMAYWDVTASVAMYENRLLMRNETDKVWRFSLPNGTSEQVAPQGILPLAPGVGINFAGTEAAVSI